MPAAVAPLSSWQMSCSCSAAASFVLKGHDSKALASASVSSRPFASVVSTTVGSCGFASALRGVHVPDVTSRK
jgi:hypothetical protein